MKKKGLIISTVVMVVVLIAALTTGTYAWFTLDGKSEITGLNLTVESTADVTFGLKSDGKFSASEVNPNSFSSGTVTFTAGTAGKPDGTWSGDIHGLSSITFGEGVEFSDADHKLSKAVGVATGAEATTAENSFDLTDVLKTVPDKSIITANESSVSGQITGATLAVENSDYLHLMLGVKSMNDVNKLSCKIEITLKGENTTLGLAAALRVVYRLNKDTFEEEKEFYPAGTNYYTEKANIKDGATSEGGGNGTGVVTIEGFKADGSINNFDLYIILAGYDSDCITAAALQGLSLEIKISFPTEKAGA